MGEFDDLIGEFVTESREHIADIEDDLIKIEADMENIDPEVINRVFRAAHSIKGSAKFLDLINIGELAHKMEDVLNLIRSGKLLLSSDIANPLLKAADMLKMMFEDVMASNDMDISEHVAALQNILDAPPGEQKAAKKVREEPVGAQITFDIDAAALAKKIESGQAFILKNLDQKKVHDDTLIRELENLGEVLSIRDEGDIKSHILFASIMEKDMLPMAIGIDKSFIIEINPDMIPSITAAPVKKPKTAKAPAKQAITQQTKKTPEPARKGKPAREEVKISYDEEHVPAKRIVQVDEEEETLNEDNTSFITFSLERETYAVPIQLIEEIIGLQDISLLPNVPDFIKGVINLRGELVPIMDLRLKFGLDPKEYNPLTVFLIVRVNERVMGMVVDNVADVLVIDPNRVQQAPAFSAKISTDFIEGVYKDTQEQMVILVDLPSLIKPDEWAA